MAPMQRDNAPPVPPEHPFRRAWRTRDALAWGDALAPAITVYSPMLSAPFVGRAVTELFTVLFEVLGHFEVTDEFESEGAHAFFWRVAVGGRTVEGVDLVHYDEQGLIREIRVMIRPLVDIAGFVAVVGPALAARKGPRRGALSRLMTTPLRGMFAAVDWLGARLAGHH